MSAKVEHAHLLQAVRSLFCVESEEYALAAIADDEAAGPWSTSIKNFAQAIADAEQRGYERCTRDVVAFIHNSMGEVERLAANGLPFPTAAVCALQELAETLGRGEHVGAAKEGGE